MNKLNGKFVTFEGIDTAGKTTIMKMLKDYIETLPTKNNYVFTREPGSTYSREAEKIRTLILDKDNNFPTIVDALLFAAGRRLNLENAVWPALKENKIVFSDRYWISSFVYQGILGDAGYDNVKTINLIATNSTAPDFIVFFDLEPKIVLKRLANLRNETDRLEHFDLDYYVKLRKAYLNVLQEYKQKVAIIDSSKTLEEMFQDLLKILKERELI